MGQTSTKACRQVAVRVRKRRERRSSRVKIRKQSPASSTQPTGAPTEPMRLSAKERALLQFTWHKLNESSPEQVNRLIGRAWLQAAENSPVWVWGLVGVDEGRQSEAVLHPRFKAITNEVRQFIHSLVDTAQMNQDEIRASCNRLGMRHRNYFDNGFQMTYWDNFQSALTDSICRAVRDLKATSTRRNSKLKLRASTSRVSETTIAIQAWQKLIKLICDEMRDGYTGEVGPVRLSLTSSLLSLSINSRSPSRAGRDRSPRPSWSLYPNASPRHSLNLSAGYASPRATSPRPSLAPSVDLALYIPEHMRERQPSGRRFSNFQLN